MSDPDDADILLVEDNRDDLDMVLRVFRKMKIDHRVAIARDGVEALDYVFCRGAHAARRIELGPKVVLLDLKLPKIDGLDVLRTMKGDPRTAMIPVVILTSSQEQRDVIEGYNLGVNSYIVKPVDFAQFTTIVEQLGMYWLLVNQPPLA